MTLVELRDVHRFHRRGSEVVRALAGVDLAIGAGEVVALYGPSGSGKSSLLHVLCGWEHPDEGTIAWLRRRDAAGWRWLSVVPQSLGLLSELTIRDNVELPVRLVGEPVTESRRRVDELLETLGLNHLENRAVTEVSMGEQQRTAFARALVLRPRLLLADEPTSHQDNLLVNRVLALIESSAAFDGTAVVFATHDDDAIGIADRVVRLRDGRIEAVTGGNHNS